MLRLTMLSHELAQLICKHLQATKSAIRSSVCPEKFMSNEGAVKQSMIPTAFCYFIFLCFGKHVVPAAKSLFWTTTLIFCPVLRVYMKFYSCTFVMDLVILADMHRTGPVVGKSW